jgi:hypothetical protein
MRQGVEMHATEEVPDTSKGGERRGCKWFSAQPARETKAEMSKTTTSGVGGDVTVITRYTHIHRAVTALWRALSIMMAMVTTASAAGGWSVGVYMHQSWKPEYLPSPR